MDVPLCCYLARVTGRPVKMIMSYAEELTAANPRHASVIKIKTGVKKDGRLWARELNAVFNGGAYAAIKENTTCNLPGARHGNGSYFIPHATVQSLCRLYELDSRRHHARAGRSPGELRGRIAHGLRGTSTWYRPLRVSLQKRPQARRRDASRCSDEQRYGAAVAGNPAQTAAGQGEKNCRTSERGFALASRDVNMGEANVDVALKAERTASILTTVPETIRNRVAHGLPPDRGGSVKNTPG